MLDDITRFFLDNQHLAAWSKKGYRDVLGWLQQYCGRGLKDITEEECKLYLSGISNAYTWNTRHAVIKRYYTWLASPGGGEKGPAVGQGKEFLKLKKHKKAGQELADYNAKILAVTSEHVGWLITAAQTLRDKALIAVLFECGFRRGEIVGIRLRDVRVSKVAKRGFDITCTGKTGSREVQCITSASLLGSWMDSHPQKNNPEAPLFCSLEHRDPEHPVRIRPRTGTKPIRPIHIGDPLQVGSIRSLLDKVIRWATLSHPGKIPHVFCHLGRHFAATSAAKSGRMNTQGLKLRFGWKTNTMPDVYCHLSGSDAGRQYLASLGMEPEEDSIIPTPQCPLCKARAPPGINYCPTCGTPMTADVQEQLDTKKQDLNAVEEEVEARKQRKMEDLERKVMEMAEQLAALKNKQ